MISNDAPAAEFPRSIGKAAARVWVCAACIIATACGDEEPRREFDASLLNDIQATVPAAQLVEDLRLDADREDFSAVPRLFVGPRDQILVPLPQDHELRIYDESGARIASVGRRGSGPGEFQSLAGMGSVADTLWVFDTRQRRVTYIAPDGAVLRTVTVPQRLLRDTTASVIGEIALFLPLAIYGDGSMLGETRTRPASDERNFGHSAVALLPPDTDAQLLLFPASYEDPRWMMEIDGFGRTVPFSMLPKMSWSADGRRLVTLHTETTTDDGGTLQLSLYDIVDPHTSGARAALLQPTLERTIAYRGEPIPQSEVDSALAEFIPPPGQFTEGPSDLPRRFQVMARTRMPAVHSPVVRLRLGLDDTIWLDLRPSPDGRTSVVLAGSGEPIGTVVVPANVTIWQSSRSHIWTLERDEFGLASVVRYRVVGLK